MGKNIINFSKSEISSIAGYKRFIELCILQFTDDSPMFMGVVICLKSLLSRIESARLSFFLLLSNGHIPEAFIVAGSMLEIISLFDFIESEPDKDKQWELVQEYITECSLSEMSNILKLDLINKLKDKQFYNNDYMNYVRQVKQYGKLLLKSNISTSECVRYLTSEKHTNGEKIAFINTSYKISTPHKKVQRLINKLQGNNKEESVWLVFNYFYAEYNNVKHGNIFMWNFELAKDGKLDMNYGNMSYRCILAVFLLLLHFNEKYKTIELKIDETK